MKIGILTLPLWNNYGGILQAYALQDVLNNLGHETWLIDRDHPKPSKYKELKIKLNRNIKKYILKRKDMPLYPTYFEKNVISADTLYFINKYFENKTEKILNDEAVVALNKQHFDAYIVGSDQVWRPRYSPSITNYFLDFVEKENTIKIAYAASFGVDFWEYSNEDTQKCKLLLKEFNSVSVREDSAVNLCEKHFESIATHVIDPTMLIDKKYYIDIVKKENPKKSPGKLFTYILDFTEEKQKIINQVSKVRQIDSFTVMAKPFSEKAKNNLEAYKFPKVSKWIKGFVDAEFTIVDSFHGAVFSIIFNKPFIVIGNKERGLARFSSLLKMFKLENRIIFSANDLSLELIKNDIDWQAVNEILETQKSLSIQFIKNSLENK